MVISTKMIKKLYGKKTKIELMRMIAELRSDRSQRNERLSELHSFSSKLSNDYDELKKESEGDAKIMAAVRKNRDLHEAKLLGVITGLKEAIYLHHGGSVSPPGILLADSQGKLEYRPLKGEPKKTLGGSSPKRKE